MIIQVLDSLTNILETSKRNVKKLSLLKTMAHGLYGTEQNYSLELTNIILQHFQTLMAQHIPWAVQSLMSLFSAQKICFDTRKTTRGETLPL